MMCSANFFPFSWVELQEILFVSLFSETVGLLLRFICVDIVLLTKHLVSYLSVKVLVAIAKLFGGISVMWTRTAFGQLCMCMFVNSHNRTNNCSFCCPPTESQASGRC